MAVDKTICPHCDNEIEMIAHEHAEDEFQCPDCEGNFELDDSGNVVKTMSDTKAGLIGIAGLLCIIAFVGYFVYGFFSGGDIGEEEPIAAESPPPLSDGQYYHPDGGELTTFSGKLFSGSGDLETQTFFMPDMKKVKITIENSGDKYKKGTSTFYTLKSEDGHYLSSSNINVETDGAAKGYKESYIRDIKAGNYYFKVIGGGVKWNLTIERDGANYKPKKPDVSWEEKKQTKTYSSSKSYAKTFSCNYCGDSYTGRGYTTIMKMVNQVDNENSPLNSYCSRRCASECIRVQCYMW